MDAYSFRLGSRDHTLGRPPKFYANSELLSSGCTFASVYAVTDLDAKAITEAGSAANFRGTVWSAKLWVDCDTEEASKEVDNYLRKEGYAFTKYTTGNRGHHYGINRRASPSHLLPQQDKAFVKQHMPGADLGLYWALHLLRLPGVLHVKTGRPKTCIERVAGKSLVLPPFDVEEGSLQQVGGLLTSTTRPSVFSFWQVLSNLTPDGGKGRHKQLIDLAIALKREAGASKEEAEWLVLEVNKGFDEPKPESEALRAVEWAYGV